MRRLPRPALGPEPNSRFIPSTNEMTNGASAQPVFTGTFGLDPGETIGCWFMNWLTSPNTNVSADSADSFSNTSRNASIRGIRWGIWSWRQSERKRLAGN